MNLPDLCYAEHPTSGETVVIRRGEMGWFATDFAKCDPTVLNARLGVTDEQAEAMLTRSMFGWETQ